MTLRDKISYNPDTGEFFWLDTNRQHERGDKVKGTLNSDGYINISVSKTLYKAHRLAWYLSHWRWPAMLHHINEVKTDNRLSNLEEVDPHLHMTKHPHKYRPAAKSRRLRLRKPYLAREFSDE